MRIIAGELRSRRVEAPAGMATRPTSDRLRETLFNVLAPRLTGCRFLDLYAGSGANGLEALSRGAREAVFVERAPPAVAVIRGNIATLGVGGRVRVEATAVSRWLDGATRVADAEKFDVIFMDPPYAEADAYAAVLGRLGGAAAGLLADGGSVVVEHRREKPPGRPLGAQPRSTKRAADQSTLLLGQYGALQRTRLLEQGDAALSFYRIP